MVSSISYLLGQNKLVTGFGMHPRRQHTHRVVGHGVARNLTASAVKYVGDRIVNSLATAIRGGS